MHNQNQDRVIAIAGSPSCKEKLLDILKKEKDYKHSMAFPKDTDSKEIVQDSIKKDKLTYHFRSFPLIRSFDVDTKMRLYLNDIKEFYYFIKFDMDDTEEVIKQKIDDAFYQMEYFKSKQRNLKFYLMVDDDHNLKYMKEVKQIFNAMQKNFSDCLKIIRISNYQDVLNFSETKQEQIVSDKNLASFFFRKQTKMDNLDQHWKFHQPDALLAYLHREKINIDFKSRLYSSEKLILKTYLMLSSKINTSKEINSSFKNSFDTLTKAHLTMKLKTSNSAMNDLKKEIIFNYPYTKWTHVLQLVNLKVSLLNQFIKSEDENTDSRDHLIILFKARQCVAYELFLLSQQIQWGHRNNSELYNGLMQLVADVLGIPTENYTKAEIRQMIEHECRDHKAIYQAHIKLFLSDYKEKAEKLAITTDHFESQSIFEGNLSLT